MNPFQELSRARADSLHDDFTSHQKLPRSKVVLGLYPMNRCTAVKEGMCEIRLST